MTPPTLTPRLETLAKLVHPCTCMADIGTDHAYLPAYLCMEGVCQSAIACDIRPDPLAHAAATIRKYRLEDRIETRLGSGTSPLSPGEAETLVIAGMGGLLMGEILQAGMPVIKAADRILLQPMTALPELREFLNRSGFTVSEEYLVQEDEKLYHILSVIPEKPEAPYSPAELYLGRRLLESRPPLFEEYCRRRREKLEKMICGLTQTRSAAAAQKLADCRALLAEMNRMGL